jgi:DNA-binding transcriptional ArsR family regulator
MYNVYNQDKRRGVMPIINHRGNLRQKIKFICNPAVEMIACFHAITDPYHHDNYMRWMKELEDDIETGLIEEIREFGNRYNQWLFVLDIFEVLCKSSDKLFDDAEIIIERFENLDKHEFVYMFLGAKLLYKDEYVYQWLEDPDSIQESKTIILSQYISDEDIKYFVTNVDEIKNKILSMLRRFWDSIYSNEWKGTKPLYSTRIKEEEESLLFKDPIDYLTSIHEDLDYDRGDLIMKKKTLYIANVNDLSEICVFPSLFSSPHLMMNISGERITIYLNMNLPIKEEVSRELVSAIRALSDETRLKILKSLMKEVKTTKKLSEGFNLAPSTVSQHLKILKEVNLVETIKVKKFVYYSVVQQTIDDVLYEVNSFFGR